MKHAATTRSPNSPRVAVLGFHKIGPPPAGQANTWFYISESVFGGYLSWLQESCWQVIDAEAFLHGLDEPESLPERSVLITFDDGYRSMLRTAVPLLDSFGFPSVLFVPVGYIGDWNRFDHGLEPEEPICDWDDLAVLQAANVSIQAHSVTHPRFSMLDDRQLRYEIEQPKIAIETNLPGAIRMFSFPYGDNGLDPQHTADVLREAGYSAGFTYNGGVVAMPPADRYSVQRLAMGPPTDLDELMGTT